MQLGRKKPRYTGLSPLSQGQTQKALTAAGQRLTHGSADSIRRLQQPWQSRALTYYDLLGEIKYAAQFYSRALANLRLYPAYLNDDGEWEETDDPVAVEQLDRIQDPGGGRSGLLGAYGRLMFLTGEALLLVSKDPETEMEQWEMLSSDELKAQGNTYLRYAAPSLAAVEYREPQDDDWQPLDDNRSAVVYRLWKRHPRFSMLADSTMQGVLELCEELILLTQTVRARARSRLAGAGVMLLDNKAIPVAATPGTDEDPNEDPFMRDLIAVMTAPIADEGSASAVVPMVLRVDVPDGMKAEDLIAHMQIVDPTQLYPETGLRRECIDRIAIGLDMPPEILLGLADSNHWSAWQIDEQVWKGHLQPVAQQLVDDLTASFFRPTLRADHVTDWDRYAIRFDAAAVINHPDRTRDAKDLFDDGAIGYEALREACGFDEQHAQTEEEHWEYLGVKLRDPGLAMTGIPTLRQGSELEVSPGEIMAPPPPGGGVESTDVVKGPPEKPPEPEQSLVGSNGHGSYRILGAADLGLLRAREVAGNRLVSLAKRDADLRDVVKGVPTGEVAAVLGIDNVRRLGVATEQELVAPASAIVPDAIRMFGFQADVAAQIVAAIEQHAVRTLYDRRPRPLPPQFQNYVAGLTAV